MYSQPFYITENIGNNSLSFENRKNPKLYVPNLIKISNFSEIKLLKPSPQPSPKGERESYEKITFQDFGFDGKLSTNFGLENFYEIDPQPPYQGAINCTIYLFDNHNHALFFWYLAKKQGKIKSGATLYHIDEHADYREPQTILEKTDLKSIFEYTNFSKINVGNYIIPAEKQGLIGKTIQIRNTKNLEDYLNSPLPQGRGAGGEGIILNLDLDFFQPDLDFIDYELKKKVVLDIAKKADVITVSTSPFFINQELALKVFKDLFYK
ncbi:MAG: UPF0489 family protein [Candidatus Gracilibacteria bacterium]|nr:UPF0489 family protein [Candidatus Gracilibacteria bacterium]MDQ7023889.1 UPF0489 family protein [Candidatus Gracilibacteria bacterium]